MKALNSISFVDSYKKIYSSKEFGKNVLKVGNLIFKLWGGALGIVIILNIVSDVFVDSTIRVIVYSVIGIIFILSVTLLFYANMILGKNRDDEFHSSIGIIIEKIESEYIIKVESERIQIFRCFMYDMNETKYDEKTKSSIPKFLGICPVEVLEARINIKEETNDVIPVEKGEYLSRIKRVSEKFGFNVSVCINPSKRGLP